MFGMRSPSGTRTYNCGNSSVMCSSYWLSTLHGKKRKKNKKTLTVNNENLSQRCDCLLLLLLLYMQTTTVTFIWVFHWITASSILPTSFVLARDSFSFPPMALLCNADFQHRACKQITFHLRTKNRAFGVLNGTRNCEKLEINRLKSPRDTPLAVKFPFYYIRKMSKKPKWLINVFIHVLV